MTRSESLPFIVRLAESTQDLQAAVEIRATAFGRHVPHLGDALRTLEEDDRSANGVILLAEQKLGRRVIGSMRLQSNAARPLELESVVELPVHVKGRRLVEGRRLGTANGSEGRMVAATLFKATYEICHAADVEFIVVGGRSSVAEMYRRLLFEQLFEQAVSLPGTLELPLHVFALSVAEADVRWRSAEHALYDFMARTNHPDLRIDLDRIRKAFALP